MLTTIRCRDESEKDSPTITAITSASLPSRSSRIASCRRGLLQRRSGRSHMDL